LSSNDPQLFVIVLLAEPARHRAGSRGAVRRLGFAIVRPTRAEILEFV